MNSLVLIAVFFLLVLTSPLLLPSFGGDQPGKAVNRISGSALPDILNTSSQAPGGLAHDKYEVDCYDQPSMPIYKPATYIDCVNAIWNIGKDVKDPRATKNFNRHTEDPEADFSVPVLFLSNTCMISIDVGKEDDHDTLSIIDLQAKAVELVDECVKPRPHLGGKVWVGRKQVIRVIVFGE